HGEDQVLGGDRVRVGGLPVRGLGRRGGGARRGGPGRRGCGRRGGGGRRGFRAGLVRPEGGEHVCLGGGRVQGAATAGIREHAGEGRERRLVRGGVGRGERHHQRHRVVGLVTEGDRFGQADERQRRAVHGLVGPRVRECEAGGEHDVRPVLLDGTDHRVRVRTVGGPGGDQQLPGDADRLAPVLRTGVEGDGGGVDQSAEL